MGFLRGRKPFSSRPFYTTVFCITLLSAYSIFLHHPLFRRQDVPVLSRRSSEDCRLVHNADDKCAFVRANCADEEAGLLEYLTFYYCTIGSAQPVAFVFLVCWLGLLFTTIGIAASDFFSINLSTIATLLGLSESLAGVTFLAFGNGSPDVFSTFAAMSSNSGSMAVGELIGAAGFITTVVAGSMALVREFKVSRKTFVRDICFFIIASAFTMVVLSDGLVQFWECCVMIAFYVFYVIIVVGWHAYSKRRHARRVREAASRSHFYASGENEVNDELEPYTDNPDDDDGAPAGHASGASAAADIAVLERGPSIRIENGQDDDDEDDREDSHVKHIAAEVTSSMRVLRTPRGRSNTTLTPIRPSLVGALEFRSVLSSLQKERNVRLSSIRSYSHDRLEVGRPSHTKPTLRATQSAVLDDSTDSPDSPSRIRALSTGNIPPSFSRGLTGDAGPSQMQGRKSPSPNIVGGRLAPPDLHRVETGLETSAQGTDAAQQSPTSLPQLFIPRYQDDPDRAPALSPFPAYTDSPAALTPVPGPGQPSQLMLPSPTMDSYTSHTSHPTIDPREPLEQPKPIKWWPYGILPAPHVLVSTLFPTLQNWGSKSVWDKFVSLISVPSIFLLVITLPVVESETTDDDPEASVVDEPATGGPGNIAAPVSFEPDGAIEPETEWQRYRRSTRSRSFVSTLPSTLLEARENTNPDTRLTTPISGPPTNVGEALVVPKPPSSVDASSEVDEDQSWNRWLLCLQIFTGPLFCVFILWANIAEGLEAPVKWLVRAMLCSLVGSLVLLAVLLLTTTAERRPKFHFLFCFLGFIIAIAWISTVAGEVVGVLKAFGIILDISEAILGLTVFAVGNSVGDLVADVTIARLGYPMMALSACFGGPLLNILLGIGLGGAYQTIQQANKRHAKYPDEDVHYAPYHIQVTGTLVISAITLLITLVALLVVVPANRWIMNRKIGFGLIALWTISTVVNLIIEITGAWGDIA